MKSTPGNPATWSACMCVKQIASSWRKPHPSDFQGICVPSPQSKRVKVDPLRSSAHESQRPGKGIMPQVPSIQISSINVLYPFVGKLEIVLIGPGHYRNRARKPCGFSPGMNGSSLFGAWVVGDKWDHPKPDRYQSLAGLPLRWLVPPERHADATVLLAFLS